MVGQEVHEEVHEEEVHKEGEEEEGQEGEDRSDSNGILKNGNIWWVVNLYSSYFFLWNVDVTFFKNFFLYSVEIDPLPGKYKMESSEMVSFF